SHFTPLLERFGSLTQALEADSRELNEIQGLRGKVKLWREAIESSELDDEIAKCAETETDLILPDFDALPPLLRQIPDPPMLLWKRGAFADADRHSIAIVGSRSASHYGLRQSKRMSEGLARAGVSVVSGLARGIDTVAHRAALDAGGRTIAVLGSGLEALYPKENRALADKIVEAGAIVSEFPLDTKAHPSNFPRRNRIVAGLSMGVLVVQAGKRSGSLITARLAQEQGREVFALPARIEDDGNEGAHDLIRKNGAALVSSVAEILEDLHLQQVDALSEAEARARPALENPKEEAICGVLTHADPTNIEEIIAATQIAAPEVSSTLMFLEMRGVVTQLPGKSYLLC
ncbi:MAG: DNA-processing protein DprA, partial [Planctomycetes bacterium]|nr:DNA-processing protein DprA [Planctomycetota bacterium]